jgi:lipoyl(octanoyl) transferase
MVEWLISETPVGYPEAVAAMEAHVAAMQAGAAGERIWLLEHPPLYTAGTSARETDLLQPGLFPVYRSGRGGQYTYHGPGQRVAYAMLDLRPRGADLRRYVYDLEEWVIRALARFDVRGERRPGRIGIWVERGGGREDKIAAIGVRVRRWIAFHGIAVNLDPDLGHFQGIVPCGIASGPDSRFGVTSLHGLGILVSQAELDMALKGAFAEVFEAGGSRQMPTAAQ